MTSEQYPLWKMNVQGQVEYYTLQANCTICCALVSGVGVLVSDWQRGEGVQHSFLHVGCAGRWKKSVGSYIPESKVVNSVLVLPRGAQPVFSSRPHLVAGKGDVSDYLGMISRPTVSVNDRTRIAGIESWGGALIGAPDTKLLENKDRYVLDEQDALSVIVSSATGRTLSGDELQVLYARLAGLESVSYLCPFKVCRPERWSMFDGRMVQKTHCESWEGSFMGLHSIGCPYRNECMAYQKHVKAQDSVYDDVLDEHELNESSFLASENLLLKKLVATINGGVKR